MIKQWRVDALDDEPSFKTFTITQHWPDGKAGVASGYMTVMVDPNTAGLLPYNESTLLATAEFSYDPYNRNPILFWVEGGTTGEVKMGYAPGSGHSAMIWWLNLECFSSGGKLILVGTEDDHGTGTGGPYPEYDMITLASLGWNWLPEDILHELYKAPSSRHPAPK
jgi:hypothetical protein